MYSFGLKSKVKVVHFLNFQGEERNVIIFRPIYLLFSEKNLGSLLSPVSCLTVGFFRPLCPYKSLCVGSKRVDLVFDGPRELTTLGTVLLKLFNDLLTLNRILTLREPLVSESSWRCFYTRSVGP